ncbi:hypothetical protein LRX75_20605 [Rhizobium sp. DKSPLA3]|uniref:Glycosyltransferase n=1 Tax=Rhizobium quercicola TaxID=2901226 RepID=A0A9X1NUQ7_9HYPH|nr:hypothetical protein [Rhizobium quercicola]MCD7111442.1 hypothetical protein [Rhizobium quercicola]
MTPAGWFCIPCDSADDLVNQTPMPRCPLCQARGLAPTTRSLALESEEIRSFRLACSHCGLLLDDAPGADAQAAFEAICARRPAHLRPEDVIGCDIYTLRTLATRFGLAAYPADPAQARDLASPHGQRAGKADLVALSSLPATPVSVGIMCSEREAEGVLDTVARYRAWADVVVVLVDRAADMPMRAHVRHEDGISVVSRHLGGDFAAQRNALQDLSPSAWMLQLDADEDISGNLGRDLKRLATLGDQQGILSIGLPRMNFVDGVQSDLYPDLQYRLNRREVRYEGIVHERPARPWQRSFIALCGEIRHHLTAEHVARRSKAYEALQPGGGRLFEEDALSRLFSA